MTFLVRIAFVVVSSLSLLLMISGCTMKSEATLMEDAVKTAQTVFDQAQAIKPNYSFNHSTIFIPNRLEVNEEDESNIILSNGEQIYIVFINHLEDTTSDLHFNSIQSDQAIVTQSFENNDRFGYIQVMPEIDGKYELQVGIGGVKITTHTPKRNMLTDVEDLMKIAISIVNSDE